MASSAVADDTAKARALEYISNPRFHQRYVLPANADHGDLVFSYADIGREASPGLPTVLFMPGMFASRYLGVYLHVMADKLGVRLIVVDRPGMGHSTDVPLGQRVSVWIELVPRILEHLGVEHVAFVSHSAGTIYLLNTLYHHRRLLHPEKPLVGLLAPYVDPSVSHLTYLQMAAYIPEGAFKLWHHIPRFLMVTAQPVLAPSGTFISKAADMLSFGSGDNTDDQSEMDKNRLRIDKDYGLDKDVQIQLTAWITERMFGEETIGANSEALQCLKKGPPGSWGACDNHNAFVEGLASREKADIESPGSEGRRKLTVKAFFGETDALIGKAGQKYVEECWKGTAEQNFQNAFDFEATTLVGTDHDTVSQSVEVWEQLFVLARDGPVA